MTSFLAFTAIAVVAHILVWMWRPWLPSAKGYAQVIDGANTAVASLLTFLA